VDQGDIVRVHRWQRILATAVTLIAFVAGALRGC
jgi:hypothetical protein